MYGISAGLILSKKSKSELTIKMFQILIEKKVLTQIAVRCSLMFDCYRVYIYQSVFSTLKYILFHIYLPFL